MKLKYKAIGLALTVLAGVLFVGNLDEKKDVIPTTANPTVLKTSEAKSTPRPRARVVTSDEPETEGFVIHTNPQVFQPRQ